MEPKYETPVSNFGINRNLRHYNLGAVEVVVAGLLAHPPSKLVQFHGCGALVAMTEGHADNLTRAVDGGAADAVSTALTIHAGSANVVRIASPFMKSMMRLLSRNKRKRTLAGVGTSGT